MLRRPYLVFNHVATDKLRAQQEWKARFENRTPPTQARTPKAVAIKAVAPDTTDILLYDEIGFWGITAKEFVAALETITTPNINVRINSPGGDVFDGLAIYNALANHKANVACVVDGLAASAASFIALAGSTVSIHNSAMMMIHRAWGFAMGNQSDMTEMAAILAKIDDQLAGIYAKKTGKSIDEIAAIMAGDVDGTWYTAQEAVDLGLVDLIIDPSEEDDDEDETQEEEMAKALARMSAMRRRLALASAE
jgi:ATP-dependent Clp endopeptidase proteolytic subunit ClpP